MNEETSSSTSSHVKSRKPFEAPRMEKIDIALTEGSVTGTGDDGLSAYNSGIPEG